MNSKTYGWALLLAAMLPVVAHAQEEEERGAMRGILHQSFLMLLNPMGMEHSFRAGFRGQLGDQDNILFMGAHAETGLVSYVSPVYGINGGYVQVSPFSFLVLRSELTHHAVWPIGMEGAGYYGLTSYDDDVQTLEAARAQSAQGWSVRMVAQAQGAVPLAPGLSLLIVDQLTGQYSALGGASHYYDMKWDLVLAREDWVLINNAVLLLEIDLDAQFHLRVGAYDDTRYVPRSGYVGHQFGPLVALTIENPAPEVPEVTPYLRAGYYTDHVVRAEEFTILAGVSVAYDLGAVH